MQPYFIPYAGYFRLFVDADLFVIYDCVQFPRRGWVHRNRMHNANGEPSWLTLPLMPSARDTQIRELEFAPDAAARMQRQCRRFPALSNPKSSELTVAQNLIPLNEEKPVDYLERTLSSVCATLGLPFRVQRSSTLPVDPVARGSDRILDILKQLNATRYINLSGGRNLYSPEAFARQGIGLNFLQEYTGPTCSILHRLLTEDAAAVADDIRAQCRYS